MIPSLYGIIGHRGLYMEMLDLIRGPMNHKRILRIMKKFGILTNIRRQNAYHKITKATYEHRIVPNHLNRRFDQEEPGKVFVTDITYLRIGSAQTVYLSCVKDIATRENMAHHVKASIWNSSVCSYSSCSLCSFDFNDTL